MRLGRLVGKPRKRGKNPPRRSRREPGGANIAKGDGQVMNDFDRRAGARNRCYACGSEYYLAPWRPQRRQWRPDIAPSSLQANIAPRPFLSLVPMDSSGSVSTEGTKKPKEGNGKREKSLPTTLEAFMQLICTKEDSVAILDTVATANLVCFRWLNRHNSMLGKMGLPRVSPYPAQARFKFGDGRMGVARFAVDITADRAGAKGDFTAFVLDADIPALLRRGASEALGGQLEFPGDTLPLGFARGGNSPGSEWYGTLYLERRGF